MEPEFEKIDDVEKVVDDYENSDDEIDGDDCTFCINW